MNPIYFVVSLALLGLAAADADAEQKGQLELLCRSGKDAPEVTRISEVRSMIDLLKSDQRIDCAPEVRNAIVALESVIELESVCSEQAADAIVAFWSNYLGRKSKLKKHLPITLKKFFIGVGLQVSKVCKQTLVEQLEQVSQEKGILEQDIDVVTKAVKESDKIKFLYGHDTSLENLMAVVRTDSALDANGKPKDGKVKITMQAEQKRLFELVQEKCINKFKPIYDVLISPIVRLAAIGLNNGDIADFKQTKIYHDWFNVVIACEPFVNYEPVVIPADKLNAIGNTAMVTILDEEDLAKLGELTSEEPAIAEPVDYKVQVHIDDLVVQPQLVDSIAGYSKGLKDVTKLKSKMLKRLPALIKYLHENNDKVKFGLKSFVEQRKKSWTSLNFKNRLTALKIVGLGLLAAPFALIYFMLQGSSLAVSLVIVPLWVIITFPFQ